MFIDQLTHDTSLVHLFKNKDQFDQDIQMMEDILNRGNKEGYYHYGGIENPLLGIVKFEYRHPKLKIDKRYYLNLYTPNKLLYPSLMMNRTFTFPLFDENGDVYALRHSDKSKVKVLDVMKDKTLIDKVKAQYETLSPNGKCVIEAEDMVMFNPSSYHYIQQYLTLKRDYH